MKIAILSDMHIQENQRASNFKHSDEELLNLFKYLENKYDIIYMVGDIFECQQTLWYPTKEQQHISLNKTIERYHKSFDYISRRAMKFIYLSGNHDSILHEGDPEKIPVQLQKIYCGRDVTLVTKLGTIDIRHGEEKHEYDTKLKYFFWFGTWLGGLYERITGKNIPTRMTTNTYPREDFKKACQENDKIVLGIRGHNHMPETYQINVNGKTRTYLNAGFSDKDTINIGELDTRTLKVGIRSYLMKYFQ